MKKMMFSDHYGLEQAVLRGEKTMTRRIAYNKPMKYEHHIGVEDGHLVLLDGWCKVAKCPYKVDEELWIAQSYKTLGYKPDDWIENVDGGMQPAHELAGYNNKMFVRSIYLQHRIRIKEIRVEPLQEISNEDCLKEGLVTYDIHIKGIEGVYYGHHNMKGSLCQFDTPYEAFHALINKTCGRDTWENNPWVWVYLFERVM